MNGAIEAVMADVTGAGGEDGGGEPERLHRIYGMPGHLIRRAHQIAVAAFADCTKEIGLTPIQYATLTVADTYPGIDQRTLAGMVAFDRSTIGDVIQRLEQRGLLRRENGEDRRTKLVSITQEGVGVLSAMDELVLQAQFRILAPLSDGEQAILMFLLSKMVNLSGAVMKSPLPGMEAPDAQHVMETYLHDAFSRASFAPPSPPQPRQRKGARGPKK